MPPILYSFRRCPYAIRARLALWISGTTCVLREVRLSAKPAALLATSPGGTVPVLVLPDGAVIAQSLEIMRWALVRRDPHGWLDRDDPALIATNDGPFKRNLDRYKYSGRASADAFIGRKAGLEFLCQLEERLMRHEQLCGQSPGIADWAIMPFIRQFAAIDPPWFAQQNLPRLNAWLDTHKRSPLFTAVMDRPRPWQDGDSPVFFGRDQSSA